jgi:hypothetical protein
MSVMATIVAVLTLAPWAVWQQIVLILFVAGAPKEPRQVQLQLLSLVSSQTKSFKLNQCEWLYFVANLHWQNLKLYVCENAYDGKHSCTYLGSLGSTTTNRTNPICCQTAQGAKVSTTIIVATCNLAYNILPMQTKHKLILSTVIYKPKIEPITTNVIHQCQTKVPR